MQHEEIRTIEIHQQGAWKRRTVQVCRWLAISLITAVLLGGLTWLVIHWHAEVASLKTKDRLDAEIKIVTTLGQTFSSAILLFGLLFTWRSLRATNRNVEVAHEGQVTERFSRAIEHLGSQIKHVRVAGIYALEGMARDAVKLTDYWTVIEVLEAYIRHNAKWNEQGSVEQKMETPIDIQTALVVIGRRKFSYAKEEHFVDLHGVDIRKAYLFAANFRGIDLADAHLEGADLVTAILEAAKLKRAHFVGADLRKCNLKGADLSDANLEGALLNGAHLEGAFLAKANFRNADLRGAHLEGAYVHGAVFKDANLEGTYFGSIQAFKQKGASERIRDVLMGRPRIKFGRRRTKLETFPNSDSRSLTLEQLKEGMFYDKAILPTYLQKQEGKHAPNTGPQAVG